MPGVRRYLAVADWDRLQYHKQLRNPPWTRLHQDWLTHYGFSQLSLPQWGVLFGMHMLAARTGNRIPYDVAWIAKQFSKRSSPVSKVILNLISTGFLLEFEATPDSKENNVIGFIRDAGVALPEPEGRGRGSTERSFGGSASLKASSSDPPPAARKTENSDPLSPPRPDVTELIDDVARQKRATNSKRRGHSNGKDHRSFDQLKASVREYARNLKSTDRQEIWKLGKQRLQMSEPQFAAAWKQLLEDGEL